MGEALDDLSQKEGSVKT